MNWKKIMNLLPSCSSVCFEVLVCLKGNCNVFPSFVLLIIVCVRFYFTPILKVQIYPFRGETM